MTDECDIARARVRAAHMIECYEGQDPEDLGTTIADALCDLRHFARSRGLKWHELTKRASMYFHAERRESARASLPSDPSP